MADILAGEASLVSLGNIILLRLSGHQLGWPQENHAAQFASFFLSTFTEYDGSCTKADWDLHFLCCSDLVLVSITVNASDFVPIFDSRHMSCETNTKH